MQRRILIVGDPASIHATRFTRLLAESVFNVALFQPEHVYRQEEHLINTALYVSFVYQQATRGNILIPASMVPKRLARLFSFLGHVLKHIGMTYPIKWPRTSRAYELARLISFWNPEVVISLKMQNDGYTVAEAKRLAGTKFRAKWIHFSWGTDFEFFGKDPRYAPTHRNLIVSAMKHCDYHIADCERDLRQAKEFGFSGESLGTCLAPGGFDLEQLEKLRTPIESRRIILVKGRQGGLVGKAQNVLAALEQIAPLLLEYQIVILMPTRAMRKSLHDFANKTGLNCVTPQQLEYSELLALFGRARLAISASDVDGTPSFLVEAMAMGALPVHSDMESVREWVKHDDNGLLFPVDDIGVLADCVKKAVLDESLVASAASLNWEIAKNRMDRHKISKWIEHCINSVAA